LKNALRLKGSIVDHLVEKAISYRKRRKEGEKGEKRENKKGS
jgi:hypothetical protein